MPWTYRQRTGELLDPSGVVAGVGYSGAGVGKNDPGMQSVPNVGPICVGFYLMLEPVNSHVHGPFAIPLQPYPSNDMHGRFGFMMHGDSIVAPGTASEGCIIQRLPVREQAWASTDHVLQVVPE